MDFRTRVAFLGMAGMVLILVGGCVALRLGAGLGRAGVVTSLARGGAAAIGTRAILPGALTSGLRGLTAGRGAPAVVSITRSGSILHRGRTLATVESDGLLVAREAGREYALGRMMHNRLWAYTESGSLVPIARLRGFVSSRGIALRSAPSSGAPRVEILRGNVTAEVLQVRDGWYEIRLPNQSTGWLWGGLLALAIIDDDGDGDDGDAPVLEDATDVLVVLQNGQSLRAREVVVESGVVRAWDSAGAEYVFDRGVVSHAVPLSEQPEVDSLVELVNGTAIIGSAHRMESGAIAIDTTSGSTLLVDATLLKNPPPDAFEFNETGESDETWRSRSTW